MIAGAVFLVLLSALPLVLLGRKRWRTRIAASLISLAVLLSLYVLFLSRLEDRAQEGSIPLTQEDLERGGMSEEEWNELVKKKQEELADDP